MVGVWLERYLGEGLDGNKNTNCGRSKGLPCKNPNQSVEGRDGGIERAPAPEIPKQYQTNTGRGLQR